MLLRATFAAALLAATLLVACGDEEKTTPERPQYLEPTSPVNVFKNLELSFNVMGYNGFKSCLSPNFVFYFNPNDVGKPAANNPNYIIPVSWNHAEMLDAVRNMFIQAFSSNMSIPTTSVGTPAADDTIWRADHIQLTLTLMIDAQSGYRIGGGYCNFEFERYEENGGHHWRLTKWYDYTRESGDSAPNSLGRVLAMFH